MCSVDERIRFDSVLCIYPTLPLWARCDIMSIFQRAQLISIFPSPGLAKSMLKSQANFQLTFNLGWRQTDSGLFQEH